MLLSTHMHVAVTGSHQLHRVHIHYGEDGLLVLPVRRLAFTSENKFKVTFSLKPLRALNYK